MNIGTDGKTEHWDCLKKPTETINIGTVGVKNNEHWDCWGEK